MNAKEDDGLYDLTPADQSPRPVRKTPPAQPIAAAPTLPYAKKPKPEFSPENLIHHKAPLALLVAGLALMFLLTWWDAAPGQLSAELEQLTVSLLLSTALMLVCIFIASRARQFTMGPVGLAIIKLMAVSIAPWSAMLLASLITRFIPFGWILTALGGFCLHFALLGVFFELDDSDTWYCVCIIFLANVAVTIASIPLW